MFQVGLLTRLVKSKNFGCQVFLSCIAPHWEKGKYCALSSDFFLPIKPSIGYQMLLMYFLTLTLLHFIKSKSIGSYVGKISFSALLFHIFLVYISNVDFTNTGWVSARNIRYGHFFTVSKIHSDHLSYQERKEQQGVGKKKAQQAVI